MAISPLASRVLFLFGQLFFGSSPFPLELGISLALALFPLAMFLSNQSSRLTRWTILYAFVLQALLLYLVKQGKYALNILPLSINFNPADYLSPR